MKLRFSPRSTSDLAEIADYIGERNPEAALKVRDAILGSLGRLAEFPKSGRQQSVEGVRKIVTRQYPYLVYYTIDERAAEVVVLSIQHPAMDREYEDL